MDNYIKNFSASGQQRVNDGYLEDHDIDYFQQLLAHDSKYKPYSIISLLTDSASEIPRNQPHIQIFYLLPPSNDTNDVGHWVTSFYDTKSIHVYDSMNNKQLSDDFKKALMLLHPYYFQENKQVVFPDVQKQTNDRDCGIFAIAFAVSVLCGIKPNHVKYNIPLMRSHLLQMLVNKHIEHFPCEFIPIPDNIHPRKSYSEDDIDNGRCLNDLHISYFHEMIKKFSTYKPCSTLYLQNTSRISQIDENEKHIQILFHRGIPIGHFICTFYDTEKLCVYDSMNNNHLHSDFKDVLIKLHPYCFNGSKPIVFKRVQQQNNGTDCGVYSIAFAVSLLLGYKPDMITYNDNLLRQLLLDMFAKRQIKHFPYLNNIKRSVQFRSCDTVRTISTGNNNAKNKRTYVESVCYTDIETSKVTHDEKLKIAKKINQEHYSKEETIMQMSKENKIKKETIESGENFIKNNCKTTKTVSVASASNTCIDSGKITQDEDIEDTKKIRNRKYYQKKKEKLKVEKENQAKRTNASGNFIQGSICKSTEIVNVKSISNSNVESVEITKDVKRTIAKKLQNQKYYQKKKEKIMNAENKNKIERETNDPESCIQEKMSIKVSKEESLSKKNTQDSKKIIDMNEKGKGIKRNRDVSMENYKKTLDTTNIQQELQKSKKNYTFQEEQKTKAESSNAFTSNVNKSRFHNYYIRNRERILSVRKFYYMKNKEKILEKKRLHIKITKMRNRDYYKRNREQILSMKINYYSKNKEKIIEKRKNRLANKIKKKYSDINVKQNTTRTLYLNKEKYIQKIMTGLNSHSIDSRLKAENLVLSAIHIREKYYFDANKQFKNLQNKIEVSLSRLGNISITDNSKCALTALCGLHKHTSLSEPYFAEAAYDFQSDLFDDNDENHKIMINEVGQITNILPILEAKYKRSKIWLCSRYCKTVDVDIIQALHQLFTEILQVTFKNAYKFLLYIDCCSAESRNFNKLGHPLICYDQPLLCSSKFLKLSILSYHYPNLRTIKKLIYEVKRLLTLILKIDNALNQADVEYLKVIAEEAKKNAVVFKSNKKSNEVSLNESELKEKFHSAIKDYTKIVIDPPSVPCISCERLFCSRDLEPFERRTKNVAFELIGIKQNLLEELKNLQHQGSKENFICRSCLTNLRKNIMPSNCVLNKFQVKDVPKELKDLNMFEKILIQRAKAFQTIKKMDTVMNKNLPNYVKIDKVVGRTFHLPLPLEETLKKICPDTDPLNLNHELFILVRSHPSKNKIIWQDFVDIQKIWRALDWLKKNNPLYEKIELPDSPKQLLDKLNTDLEYQIEFEKEIDVSHGMDGMNELEKKEESKNRPLLTQKSETDSFYDHYTIYPLHNKKANKTDTELYQMLEVHASALDNRGKDLDLKCFPDLYPYGEGGQTDERIKGIRDFDFIKSRLASKHARFRLNHQYLFYLLNNNTMRQINAGIYQMMNVVNPRFKYTVREFLQMLNEGKLDANLDTVFSHLPGTEAYWRKVRNDLNCMVREYGPATFFVTLSPGEWMWPELAEYIREVNNNNFDDNLSISQLIAADPVSTARFFQNKFQATLAYILSKDNPIGKVIHYYWVREYQGRGLPHYHCLFWIKDAPVYGRDSNEEVQEFILNHITCHIPDRKISPELHRRVLAYQQHRHNSYCMRKKKTKTGFTSACRFGFPRPITDKLILRDVSVSIANRNKLKNKCRFYDLPRTKDEQFVNDYMPALLLIWEGNNDAQYIGEASYLLTKYVCKYGTKGEKSNLDMSEVKSNQTLYSRLWSFAVRALNHRECGAIEAADTLLGHPLHATDKDTIIKWLNVGMIRGRKLKSYKDIKNLPEDSTDIFCDSFVDNHYPNRPKELDDLSLYDFARWFDVSKNKPVYKAEYYKMSNDLYCKKRKKPYVINHYHFNPDSEPESYYFSLLLMFQPWRDVDELKGSEKTYIDAFKKKQSDLLNAMMYHDKSEIMKEAQDNMNKLIQKELEESQTNAPMDCDNIPDGCVPVEVENAMNDFKAIADNAIVNKEDLQNSISQLNSDQSRVFNKVKTGLEINEKPVRMFISGFGGTGKSFLIQTIVSYNKIIRGKDTAVTAPTGIAAYNIQGLTLHRLLQLPVEHGGTAEYKELSGASLKQIRQSLRNVDLIIVDEISMVSNVTFMYIHLRLTEIFNTSDCEDGWFGKVNVLVFGDLLQLPPVRENFVFVEMNKKQIEKYVKSMITYNLWELFDYDELTINMRQKDDKIYSEILSRIRLGFMTNSDIEILQSRIINLKDNYSENVQELCDHLIKLPIDTVCLLPTKKMCDILNKAMMRTIDGKEIILIADDSFRCANNLKKKVLKILNDDEDNFCGIERVITIKIGSKIMIRRNIDVSIGLVNGTICLVASISKDKSNNVASIRVELQSGKQYDITQLEYKFNIMDKISIVRKQFPICNSYGITIHKSQGLSLKNAVVEAGNNVFSNGQTYVAFSRVTTLEGLHLINFDPSCCTADTLAILEYNRLRSKYRPDLNQFNIPTDRKNMQNLKVVDKQWAIKQGLSFAQCESHLNYIFDSNWNIRGLPNTDGVSSYANACIQSLFHSSTIRRVLLQHNYNDIVKTVFKQYINKIDVDIQSLREFAGNSFKISERQDVAEFLFCILNKSLILQNVLSYEMNKIIRCVACDKRNEVKTSNFIVSMYLPESDGALTLQEIIDYNIGNWQELDDACPNGCKLKRLKKVDLQIKNTIFILQLILFSNDNNRIKKKSVKINGIPTAKISLCNKFYKVVNGIFHSGTGHYTNVLREKNNWIKVDDSKVQKAQWPKSAKDIYILFLEQI